MGMVLLAGISISPIELLVKGIPEGFLVVLAMHIFTRTKIKHKHYLLLGVFFVTITYLIRFLPITLGVNTMLSLLALIALFQVSYKFELSQVVKPISSAVVIMVLIMFAEVLNLLLLTAFVGQDKAEEYFNSSNPVAKVISTSPSTVFFALFIFIGYLILSKIDKNRKGKDGKTGTEAGE